MREPLLNCVSKCSPAAAVATTFSHGQGHGLPCGRQLGAAGSPL
jgi:hypothetical protein